MRIFTLFLSVFFFTAMSAQVVLVNSPSDIAGDYEFGTGFGADLNSDVWTGDVEFVNDGTALPTEGCNALINDLTGKIALIDRGSCEFGVKCLNAEMAGAIAAVVFNHTPGAGVINMGAGAVGGQVTIPCVFLSWEDGQTIRDIMMTQTVNMTIGAVKFSNEISSSNIDIIHGPLGVVPVSQADASGDFGFIPGAVVTNEGLNPSTNVTVTTTIGHSATPGGSATQVYSETDTYTETLEPDSAVFLVMNNGFDAADNGMGAGVYTVSYDITSDSSDALENNNFWTSDFIVSDNLYNKGGWDFAANQPRVTTGYTIAGGGPIEFLSIFTIPDGVGFRMDSAWFNFSTNAASLAGQTVNVFLYDWEDLNGDGGFNNDELTLVGFNIETFDVSTTETAAMMKLPIIDFETDLVGVPVSAPNKTYILGVRYEGAETSFFGFDENIDYERNLDVLFANGELTDADFPYIGINAWNGATPDIEAGFTFTDLWAPVSTAMVFTDLSTSTEEVVEPENFNLQLFPNPAENISNLFFELPETADVSVSVSNMMGQEVLTQELGVKTQGEYGHALDISGFSAGMYLVTFKAGNQIATQKLIVK